MSPLRRLLIVLGLLILLASICLLVVANLPNEHVQDRQFLPPEDLTLPTPEAFAPSSFQTAASGRSPSVAVR